jgi:hypothetical protein
VVADDDLLPLVQEGVCPDHFVHSVLGQGEEQVHHREREQDIRVDEDTRHRVRRSVRQARSLYGISDAASSRTSLVPAGLEGQHVGESHPAVPAARDSFEGDFLLVEQPHDIGAGKTEELPRLSRRQRDV